MIDPDLTAVLSDPYWQRLHDFLADCYGDAARLLVPAPLDRAFAGAVAPPAGDAAHLDGFEAVAIHKGDYAAIPADLLYAALIAFRPVFANEVFIVVARHASPDVAIDRAHLGAIPAILSWARAHASAAVVATTVRPRRTIAPADALARMARLIARDLVKPVDGTELVAVAETALPFVGTRWFWGDDAAKVAELFCLPALRRDAPDIAERMIDTIMALSPGGIIRRRIGPAEVQVEAASTCDFRVLGPFTITFGDLSRGRVRQAIRFNDGRTRPLVCFVPGTLACTWRGRAVTCDIADSIFAHSIEQREDRVLLRHVSTIRHPEDATREIGTVTCTYTLAAGRTAIGVEMVVRPSPFVTLGEIVVTSGLDAVDELGRFDRLTLIDAAGDASTTAVVRGVPVVVTAQSYLSLWEGRTLHGHAVGVHIAPRDGVSVDVTGTADLDDRLDDLRWQYCGKRATRRAPFVVREDRLVTAGGYHDRATEYRALVQEAAAPRWCHDPSMTYDTGVELNAVATWIFFARRGVEGAASTGRMTAARDWFDRHLALYLRYLRPDAPHRHERIFVRGLAFAILALDTAARAFDDPAYRDSATQLTAVLQGTEVPVEGIAAASIFGSGLPDGGWRPELDSQCAALLALGRIACAPAASIDVAAAIERGLTALRIAVPTGAAYGNDPLHHATIVISRQRDDDELVDTGFWTYKLGLALRAFRTIAHAVAIGRLDLSAAAQAHLAALDATAVAAILQAADDRGPLLEVRTSFNAGETNSETQPWVALGLVPAVDEAILGGTMPPFPDLDFPLHDLWDVAAD